MSIVTWMSLNASRMFRERSPRTVKMDRRRQLLARNDGSSARMASVTSMVLLPGCRMTDRLIERCGARPSMYSHDAFLLSSTSSIDVSDLRQPQRSAVAIRHDQRAEGVGVHQLAAGLDVEGLVGAEQLPRRQIDVPVLQRLVHLVQADLLGLQLLRIDLHAHRVFLRALHLHLRHAAHHRDARRNHASRRSRRARDIGSVSDVRPRYMIGWSAGLNFRNDGGAGMPAGSSGITAAMAVCTSTAALSMLRPRSNCSVTLLLPVELDERHLVDARRSS